MLSPEQFQYHQAGVQRWLRDQRQSGLDVVSRPGLAVVRTGGGDLVLPSAGPEDVPFDYGDKGALGVFGQAVDGESTGDYRIVNTVTRAVDEGGRLHRVKTFRFHEDDTDAPPTMAWTHFMPDQGVRDANPDMPQTVSLHHGTENSRSLRWISGQGGPGHLHTEDPDEFASHVDRAMRASGRPSQEFDPNRAAAIRRYPMVGLLSGNLSGPWREADEGPLPFQNQDVVMAVHPESQQVFPVGLRDAGDVPL